MEKMIKLANLLVNYSTEIKQGEKVLIEAFDAPSEFVAILVDEVFKAGGFPFVLQHNWLIDKKMILNGTEEFHTARQKHKLELMKDMDAYIGVRAKVNTFNLSDVPSEKMILENKFFSDAILAQRVDHTKWVILNYPTPAFAQNAGLPTDVFEKYYFDVCTFDYKKMQAPMEKLKALMDKTDKVHIKGTGTDLTFSIKGIGSVVCAGQSNIPDGEVFTAPVKDSVNGYITYTIPTVYDGKRFDNVYLEVENGKIVKATSSNTKAMNEILDSDEGARYFGEFAIGVNPFVTIPMLDILFDEKMAKSFHLTPGECYEEANNGNKSIVHWDLVCNQSEEYGGGEIYFDDVLIRKDGIFILPELEELNFKNLLN